MRCIEPGCTLPRVRGSLRCSGCTAPEEAFTANLVYFRPQAPVNWRIPVAALVRVGSSPVSVVTATLLPPRDALPCPEAADRLASGLSALRQPPVKFHELPLALRADFDLVPARLVAPVVRPLEWVAQNLLPHRTEAWLGR